MDGAPDFPKLPPIRSTCPNFPLLPLTSRGACTVRIAAPVQCRSVWVCAASAGVPMGATTTGPKVFPEVRCPKTWASLGATNVTTALARKRLVSGIGLTGTPGFLLERISVPSTREIDRNHRHGGCCQNLADCDRYSSHRRLEARAEHRVDDEVRVPESRFHLRSRVAFQLRFDESQIEILAFAYRSQRGSRFPFELVLCRKDDDTHASPAFSKMPRGYQAIAPVVPLAAQHNDQPRSAVPMQAKSCHRSAGVLHQGRDRNAGLHRASVDRFHLLRV